LFEIASVGKSSFSVRQRITR